jgi:hypothetical protein
MSESTRPADRPWDDERLAEAYRDFADRAAPAHVTEASLAAVMASAYRPRVGGFAWPAWRHPRMALSLLGLAATVVLASGLLLSLSSRGTPGPGPSQASDTQGQFQLTFVSLRTNWRTSDAITGQATLSYLGSGGVDIGSSGTGPLNFVFEEVGGTRHMGGAFTSDLVIRRLDAGKPITSPIMKSGGWNGDDPNAEFYRSWIEDPQLHLPAGDWTISAIAKFATGDFSAADQHSLQAQILIHVTG